jgi:hypothetical protein
VQLGAQLVQAKVVHRLIELFVAQRDGPLGDDGVDGELWLGWQTRV